MFKKYGFTLIKGDKGIEDKGINQKITAQCTANGVQFPVSDLTER